MSPFNQGAAGKGAAGGGTRPGLVAAPPLAGGPRV